MGQLQVWKVIKMTVERSIMAWIARADLLITNYWPIMVCGVFGLLAIMTAIIATSRNNKHIK